MQEEGFRMPSAVIVGAGIGGLATAIGLHRSGWDVSVYERWPEVVGVGAALGLWPEAQAVLEEIGVGEAVLSEALPYRHATIRNWQGSRLSDLPLSRIERTWGRPVVLISRARLMAIMLEALRDRVDIHTGVAVDSVAEFQRSADLVVGADGLRSTVRGLHFSDQAQPVPAGFTAWRGVVEDDVDEYGEYWGQGLMFGMTPMEPGRTNWYAAVGREHMPRVNNVERPKDLAVLFDSWPPAIMTALLKSDASSLLRHEVFDLAPHLESFVSGNVVVIGDAAHAMTPSLGQGACQALIDAGVLVREVQRCVQEGGAIAMGLGRFDAQRRRPTQRAVVMSRRLSKLAMARNWTGTRDVMMKASAPLAR